MKMPWGFVELDQGFVNAGPDFDGHPPGLEPMDEEAQLALRAQVGTALTHMKKLAIIVDEYVKVQRDLIVLAGLSTDAEPQELKERAAYKVLKEFKEWNKENEPFTEKL